QRARLSPEARRAARPRRPGGAPPRAAERGPRGPGRGGAPGGGPPLPPRRSHRHIGLYAGLPVDVDGNLVDAAEHARRAGEWLPSAADKAFVASLMRPVPAPGEIAGWIAPPPKGINRNPLHFPSLIRRAESLPRARTIGPPAPPHRVGDAPPGPL